MINNPKHRKKFKRYLIITNIVLSFFFFCLLVFGLFIARSSQIVKSTELGQHVSFDINNLLQDGNRIVPDYIGIKKDLNDLDKNKVATNEKIYQDSLKDNKIISSKPKLAIIVTNLGLNRFSTEFALSLPKQFALGFLPYTTSLKPLLYKAQEHGHEIYIYLPCETDRASDNPGKYALMNNLSKDENILRLNMILNAHPKYNGVYTSYKEKFTQNQEMAEVIVDRITDRNLIFILGREKNLLYPQYLIEKKDVLINNIVIDSQLDKEMIKYNLKRLIVIAKKNKVAIGYAQGYPLTISILNDWLLEELEKQGVELVPLSNLLK